MDNRHINERLLKLRGKMAQKELDSVLVASRENYFYLSGFNGTSAYLLITASEAMLVTDFRYVEQAAAQAPVYDVVRYSGNAADKLSDLLSERGLKRLGFEDTRMTWATHREYAEKFKDTSLCPVGAMVEDLRQVKDECELDIIRRAVRIADDAYKHILGFIRPGAAETDLAAEIEYFMKKQGAAGASFETIVASGLRSSMPHGVASGKKLEMGDAVTLDYGAVFDGYCSDITRTVFLGEPGDELRKIYGIVLDAQKKAIQGAAAGLAGSGIDAVARGIIADAGYGEYFGHGLGHGVGIEIHEEPRFSPSYGGLMRDGMVVTAEPGIYVPGLGGVRNEDIIIINGDKPIVLTKAPKELMIV